MTKILNSCVFSDYSYMKSGLFQAWTLQFLNSPYTSWISCVSLIENNNSETIVLVV